MDEKYKIFKRGQTVGYAPGSWSQTQQVALGRTKPHGRIIGVDLLPAQPPSGVTAFQGDFSSPMVQKLVKDLIVERHKVQPPPPKSEVDDLHDEPGSLVSEQLSYIDMERHASQEYSNQVSTQLAPLRLVDVVLSDMSAPWEQTSGFNTNTMSNPYHRLMNTSGMPFRDHAGSMDLCDAALQFASDTLRPGGHFICKFYQGTEDKHLEKKLRQLFGKVHREKPESSRSVCLPVHLERI
ncbi:21S rRNA (uridine2791-2'-O)-methyltransferase [Geosmithia morbida]|uniref:rRNA methyltransferase 2, mitochondrial n=1 Tax=Geosmithia morbida TaxID=1094350 RepID=A0A9P4YR19_9HYPO|nr:21S rRNA (uridine2791-2'-O)-methyltransferase [Geosmithia morbida]KAF4121002.1 21S rRNA (uridine2791-2'-O)-methyltransferase [Geosmithia morbida]